MTEPFLGAGGSASAAAPGTGTTAVLSAAALRANIPVARALGAADDRADPFAADAWGHGASWVRDVLEVEGIDAEETRGWAGEALYGLLGDGVRPVMRLAGRVLSTKALRAGEGVSYGYLHRAEADTHVALVTGGYAQGVVRALGGRIAVVIDGVVCPVIGRVAMDVCVVEIGGAVVERGAEAVYFGDPLRGEPSVRGWASASGLTSAEIVTSAGLKARRVLA